MKMTPCTTQETFVDSFPEDLESVLVDNEAVQVEGTDSARVVIIPVKFAVHDVGCGDIDHSSQTHL